ncbi:MAG: aminotransferase class III-fold pyridoxal phosphate-dependent enzyme, partial [Kiritimatiellia bacterium]|nr:aminotransferase class III-fold pyridoxal phosphate-dependent enzyme [Kiritimatiellia bacterium]
ENIVALARRKGEMMMGKMAALQSLKGVNNVRCLGMIAAVELSSKDFSYSRIQAIKQSLLKHGILIRPLGNVIYLMPPLTTPDKLLADTIGLLAEAAKSTEF